MGNFPKNEALKERFVFTSLITAICLNLVFSLQFYPSILPYQPSAAVGREVQKAEKGWDEFYSLYHNTQSLDFYSGRTNHYRFPDYLAARDSGLWVYTGEKGKAELDSLAQDKFRVLETYKFYKISNLSLKFLRRDGRDSAVQKLYLLEKID